MGNTRDSLIRSRRPPGVIRGAQRHDWRVRPLETTVIKIRRNIRCMSPYHSINYMRGLLSPEYLARQQSNAMKIRAICFHLKIRWWFAGFTTRSFPLFGYQNTFNVIHQAGSWK